MKDSPYDSMVEKATCISCHKTFWATPLFMALVRGGEAESLCRNCETDPDLMDDDSGTFEEEVEQPNPEER